LPEQSSAGRFEEVALPHLHGAYNLARWLVRNDQDADAQMVRAALAELPLEFREVMVMRELEELSYKEIAAIADLPIGTVMSRLARGRKRLHSLLVSRMGVETKGMS